MARRRERENQSSVEGTAAGLNPRQVIVRYGITETHLGHNRRVILHGCARNEWEDPDGKHVGYFNPEVNFICFHDASTLEGAYEVCRGSISENMERPYIASALKALARR